MQPDLETLQISVRELEHLTGLEISETAIGRAVRPSLFRSPRRLFSFACSQLLTLGLILVFCLPLSLMIARSAGGLSENSEVAWRAVAAGTGVAGAIALLWNLYRWQQTRRLKTLTHLIDQVDRHNQMIEAVAVLDELSTVQGSGVQLTLRTEVLQALTATRESLVCGLMTEKILRKHQRLIVRRHELFDSIEANLTTLQMLQVNHQANDYAELLNEALEIGVSVRREIEPFG